MAGKVREIRDKPLHLLVVSNTAPARFVQGSDRDWVNLINALGPEKVRVTWAGVNGTEQLRAALDERTIVRLIDVDQPCFYELTPDNAYTKRSVWLWTKIGVASSINLCKSFFQLRRVVRHDPVDIVVSTSGVVLLGAFFACLTNRPHIWSVKEYFDPQVKACRIYTRAISRFSSAVVVPSTIIGTPFARRVQVLPDGGNIEHVKSRIFSTREEVLRSLNLPLELPMVAQIGALCGRKGQYLTAEALAKLAQRGPPNFSLVFFGSGNSEELQRIKLILASASPEWQAVVKFSTFEHDDFSFLAAADIVVHPSVFHDAFPNAVREAMILGKPVIASRLGGMPDMIEHNQTGILIRPDAEALAEALEYLVAAPQERRRLAVAAGLYATKHFDIHSLRSAFWDLLIRNDDHN